MIWIIPPDAWKKNRDRILRQAARRLHLVAINPGPDSARLRDDYALTRAELAIIVEEVMRETERVAIFHSAKKEAAQK